jgi:hypothetical protein
MIDMARGQERNQFMLQIYSCLEHAVNFMCIVFSEG